MGLADDQLAETIWSDLELWGIAGVYTPQGGLPKTIFCIPINDAAATEDDFDDPPDVTYRVWRVKISARNDIEGQVFVSPTGKTGAGDTFVVGGETWYVRGLERDGVLDESFIHHLRLTDTNGPERV